MLTQTDRAMWNLLGTPEQREIAQEAVNQCDFPFEVMRQGLAKENKTAINCEWQDLSRYSEAREHARAHDDEHSHVTDGGMEAHPIEREVDGRKRVLGLFYLPPYTKVVLDRGLTRDPRLAWEVFLAEAAHAVDYHFMTGDHRRAITNALHQDDLPVGHSVADGVAFNLDGHTCSWFDVGPYRMWVGEAFMETFTESFAPSVNVSIALAHPTGPAQAAAVRDVLLRDVVFGLKRSVVVHDAHAGIKPERHWPSLDVAQMDGRRGCHTCKPGR